MLKDQEKILLRDLRINSRRQLQSLAIRAHMPISTTHVKIKRWQEEFIQFTSLPDFGRCGFPLHTMIIIHTDNQLATKKTLLSSYFVNTLFSLTSGANFLCECIFPSFSHQERFLKELHVYGKVQVYPVVEIKEKEKMQIA